MQLIAAEDMLQLKIQEEQEYAYRKYCGIRGRDWMSLRITHVGGNDLMAVKDYPRGALNSKFQGSGGVDGLQRSYSLVKTNH